MPLVIAHRGAHEAAPENTLEAFERAIALGVDLIELDVRRSADGELVVYHDAEVDGIAVSAIRAADLRDAAGRERAPTLSEVVSLTAGRIGLDIEVKEPGWVERVVALLPGFGLERFLLTSFIPEVVAQAGRLAPGLRTGLLVAGPARPPDEVLELVRSVRAEHLAIVHELADAPLLVRAQAAGIGCLVWTVNDPAAIDRYLADPAVTGLITDRPELALSRRAVSRARTGSEEPG